MTDDVPTIDELDPVPVALGSPDDVDQPPDYWDPDAHLDELTEFHEMEH